MASSGPPERYRFGPFELQLDQRRLLKDGAALLLRPRTFDLLVVLVEHAGRLVTKSELLDQVWPRAVVEEAALHVQVSALRKIVGSDAITTVSGRGYQFALPVTKSEASRVALSNHNLPYQLTSFVGREQEIAQLEELVTANRLVTLTGAGGAGKTRLAIEVAKQLIDAFPDGVRIAELAALSDPRLVPQAVAQALEAKDRPARPVIETIIEYLGSRRVLLVLDNVEHLLEACVQLVDVIVRRCPDVAILVTTREPLRITGELTYRVPSLTVPGPNETLTPKTAMTYEGVRLFVDRAKLLRPDFDLTVENASRVASICARLDGIPLAIELAAPRLRSMSVDELSERLDRRFALLADGSRAALPRHRTLRAMIDWSYDQLIGVEQTMLRRLAVFAGGWTMAAAEHACVGDGIGQSDIIDLLTSLADKNLVLTEERERATRYRMLETIRQYALDRLREGDDEARWRNRHLAWVLALAEESFEPLTGPDHGLWLDRIARELDNFRAALGWAIEQKLPDALRIAPDLSRWWIRRALLTEACDWFTRLLDVIPRDQAKGDRARALNAVGNLALCQGDYDEAERLFRESLALFQELEDARRSANAQLNLAVLALARGQDADAKLLLSECAALARSLGALHPLAVNLGNLAIVVHARGDVDKAATLFKGSLTLAREVGDRLLVSEALGARGRAECRDGNLESAEASLVEGLTIAGDLANPYAAAEALEGFAELAVAKHAPQSAATILGAAARLREATGFDIPQDDEHEIKRVSVAARAALGGHAFDQAWQAGRAMDLEEAVRCTLNGCVAIGP